MGARQQNQQERIGQEIKSGQLTARESAHLENQQTHLNKEVNTMRAANGGRLTPGERNLVNHQENKTSKAIYNKKHNGRVRVSTESDLEFTSVKSKPLRTQGPLF